MATLFTQPFLLQQAEAALTQLLEETAPLPLLCITGLPVALDNRLYNTAVVFCRGQILAQYRKATCPTTTNFMKTAGSLREPNLTQNEYRSAGRKLPFRPACCSNAAMYASA